MVVGVESYSLFINSTDFLFTDLPSLPIFCISRQNSLYSRLVVNVCCSLKNFKLWFSPLGFLRMRIIGMQQHTQLFMVLGIRPRSSCLLEKALYQLSFPAPQSSCPLCTASPHSSDACWLIFLQFFFFFPYSHWILLTAWPSSHTFHNPSPVAPTPPYFWVGMGPTVYSSTWKLRSLGQKAHSLHCGQTRQPSYPMKSQ